MMKDPEIELQEALDRAAEATFAVLVCQVAQLEPRMRVRLVEMLNDRFCIHCGEDYDKRTGVCYCRRYD